MNLIQKKILLGIVIFALGILGMLSMLTIDLPLPQEVYELLSADFSDSEIRWLILINPTILLVIAVVTGTLLYDKTGLQIPIIEKLVGLRNGPVSYQDLLKSGVLGGLVAGSIIALIAYIFSKITPAEFEQIGQSLQPSLAVRFLYGGITEEIFLRFGLMTLLVWLFSKIWKNKPSISFWVAISISTVLFAVGHFPVVYQSVENPSITFLTYILLGNSIGGLIFGWLYWRKGLESAFLAHIFVHVVLVMTEGLV